MVLKRGLHGFEHLLGPPSCPELTVRRPDDGIILR